MIDWDLLHKEDYKIIRKISLRAIKMAKEVNIKLDRVDIDMDISAAHITSPLKLTELLNADNFNFAHDVFGIHKKINHDTGEMMNGFLPRYSVKQ